MLTNKPICLSDVYNYDMDVLKFNKLDLQLNEIDFRQPNQLVRSYKFYSKIKRSFY